MAARTDLSRYATRVTQNRSSENASLISARKSLADADVRFATFEGAYQTNLQGVNEIHIGTRENATG
ncbi:MAG: hypothetical protein JHC61_14555, partial [Burkholderiaceae bacterium]|nr:hypothetical protein [Burkholderiaceae bacterium]